MENKDKPANFWVGFFLGGFFGLFLLILWGTKEGKKIVKLLAEKGEILEGDIENKLREIEKKGEELLSKKTNTLPSPKKPRLPKTTKPPAKTATQVLKAPIQAKTPRKFFRKSGKKLSS